MATGAALSVLIFIGFICVKIYEFIMRRKKGLVEKKKGLKDNKKIKTEKSSLPFADSFPPPLPTPNSFRKSLVDNIDNVKVEDDGSIFTYDNDDDDDDNDAKRRCNICGDDFKGMLGIEEHLKTHHKDFIDLLK